MTSCVTRLVSCPHYRCSDGSVQAQTVIRWTQAGDDVICGQRLMYDDWYTEQLLPLSAFLDGLYDNDLTRELVVYERHYVDDEMIYEKELKTIQVT